MVELDKTLEPLTKVVNECYEALFPGLPQYPKFSFTRAMITLWKTKVYSKIESNLAGAFVTLLDQKRQNDIKLGELKTHFHKKVGEEEPQSMGPAIGENEGKIQISEEYPKSCFIPEGVGLMDCSDSELIARFVQAVADLSVNELTIHYLGSTKAVLETPYKELNNIILKQTK